MQRFNDDGYFGRPQRHLRQPANHEIRIPARRPGYNHHGWQYDRTEGRDSSQVTAPPPSRVPVAEMRQPETTSAEAVEWKEKYTRLYADRENERKRIEKQYAQQAAYQHAQLLRDMLPTADNLARALEHSEENDDTGIVEGVKLTMKALAATLAKHGVTPIEAEGKRFDPTWHEATGAIPHPTLPPGTIIRVEETGYRLGDRLLRPARVLVVAG